jgi:hypothetical protein
MRAEVKGNAENCGVGNAPPAEAIARLQQHETAVGGGNAPRRGNTGGTRTDNRHVNFGARLSAHDSGCGNKCRGSRKERASAKPRHGPHTLAESADSMPEPASCGKFYG